MVYLKTYYHQDKVSPPVTQLKSFESEEEAIEFMKDEAKSYGLLQTPDPSIHYFEFLSKEEFEAQIS